MTLYKRYCELSKTPYAFDRWFFCMLVNSSHLIESPELRTACASCAHSAKVCPGLMIFENSTINSPFAFLGYIVALRCYKIKREIEEK